MLTGRVGLPLRARIVMADTSAIQPGESRQVLVVADLPQLPVSPVFALELVGNGRALKIPNVRFPKTVSGATP